jgi:hypothetical protein
MLVINKNLNRPIKNLDTSITKIKFNPNCFEDPQLLLSDNQTVKSIDLSKKYYYLKTMLHT